MSTSSRLRIVCQASRRMGDACLAAVLLACLTAASRADGEPVATGSAASERTARLPARADRSPEDRRALAAELRRVYAGDPSTWPAPHVDPDVTWKEIGLLPPVEHPDDNPHTAAKEALGRTLFFDPRLSGSGQIACASCHDPDLGWADGRTTSFGHSRKHLARNAPTVRNTAFQQKLFWDGRAESLEDQARQVLMNPDEMRSGPEHVVALLTSQPGYEDLWQAAYDDVAVSIERAAEAIACFERTVVGGGSKFDAFMKGNTAALSDSAVLGLDLFRRDARCMNCHNGPAFSDGGFHDLGLSNYGRPFEDLGRGRVTGVATDTGKFRTPSLRDATATAPLMHNGLFELDVALTLYNAGMPTPQRKQSQADDPNFPVKSPHLKPLGLNKQDLADLTAFLQSLEEPRRRIRPPEIPGLHPAAQAQAR